MFFYPILLVIIMISSFCVTYGKEKSLVFFNKIITFNLLFIPAAIRYGIGCDYDEYVYIFNWYVANNVRVHVELGYFWLNRIVFLLGLDVQWVFVIVAFLTLICIFIKIRKQDWIIVAPITMIMVYSWMLTEIRQVLAMAMLFAAIKYWYSEKKKTSIVILIASFFFHKSVIIYGLFILLIHFLSKISKNRIIFLFFFMWVVVFIFQNQLSKLLLKIIALTSYGKEYLSITGEQAKWVGRATTKTGLGRLLRYFIYSIFICFYPVNKKNKKNYLLFFSYCCVDFVSSMIMILGRIQRTILFTYYNIGHDYYYSKKNKSFSRLLLIICFLLLFFLDLYGSFNGSINFKTVFNR